MFARLRRDTAGNTLAMIAAGLVPLLALVGGGIDMGRSYLSQTRLQQACDAGVLAARKKLGSAAVVSGDIPDDAATIGNRFFNVNFRDGAYGTGNRSFDMTLEPDYAVSGVATVDVPATIMALFGYTQMPIRVECEAQLNFSNTDVMFVLDTTGSMAQTNAGDSQPKLQILRDVVKNFHAQLEASKSPGMRTRYGFVPYSTNVNVGRLLKSDWVVDSWDYRGRVVKNTGNWLTIRLFRTTYTYVGGSQVPTGSYDSATCPDDSITSTTLSLVVELDGSIHAQIRLNGTGYSCAIAADGSYTKVTGTQYTNYTYNYDYVYIGLGSQEAYKWQYRPVTQDLAFIKGSGGDSTLQTGSIEVPMSGSPSPTPANMTASFRGCIEERDTYEITDFDDVDLSRALDLDIDLVPSPDDPATQWRPMINEISWVPKIDWRGKGTFQSSPVVTDEDYLNAQWAGLSACPTEAQKLKEMDASEISGYLDGLYPDGSTYHDIGMIWGGRLLSPTGLFAEENAEVGGKPTSRHLIFLTDGITAPLDLSYGTYGIEPLDQRRWSRNSPYSLAQVVEGRFGVACSEVKKRNITVWVIGFGTTLNPIMTDCAGPGHYFEADNASELENAFSKIAAQLGDLRISK